MNHVHDYTKPVEIGVNLWGERTVRLSLKLRRALADKAHPLCMGKGTAYGWPPFQCYCVSERVERVVRYW